MERPSKIRRVPQPPQRSNWLLVHVGDATLSIDSIEGLPALKMVQECHSKVIGGNVFTFLHLCMQVREFSLRASLREVLPGGFDLFSFCNPQIALQTPELRVMALCYDEKCETLASSWRKGPLVAGFFFGSLVKKLISQRVQPPSPTEICKELEVKIQTLEWERDEYKRKYEVLAERFAGELFD